MIAAAGAAVAALIVILGVAIYESYRKDREGRQK